MNDNRALNDAEEYDLESLENILLDWPMRCRTKLTRQNNKGGSGRKQRVNRTCCTKRVKKDEEKELRKTKLEPSKYSKSQLPQTIPSELLPVLPIRHRSSRQNTHLQTVSILDTLVELAQKPNVHLSSPSACALVKTNHSSCKPATKTKTTTTPSSSSSSSKKERRVSEPRALPVARGQTPDWIKDVFELVKKGEADKLLLTLQNMDAILIRNLSDQHGNNLFHVCAWNGQVECVKVLLEQGEECKEALYDENKQGFTPIVLSIKKGHLEFLKFLIECSDMRDRLLSDNSRPLIHWAAKYGQDTILKWLIIYMQNHDLNLNVNDGDGNTALHIASKFGHISCIKVLVENEVDLTAQNHLGHKPAEAARAFGHEACFEYLTALETSLLLAYEVSSLEEELHNVRMETIELKKHYKEVLSCAKKSLKEKEELGSELKLLRTHINQLNEFLASEVQALKLDNPIFDDTMKHSAKEEDRQSLLENLNDQYDNIQQQLEDSHNRCCAKSTVAEREAKILAADEKWRKIKSRMTHSLTPCRKPIAILNEMLGQVHCRSSSVSFEELGHLSTSESSLTSICSADIKFDKFLTNKTVDKTPTKSRVRNLQKRHSEHTGELKRVSSVPAIPGPAMPSSKESPYLVKLLGELTVNNLGPPLSTFADPDDVTCTVLEVIESLNPDNQVQTKNEKSSRVENQIKDKQVEDEANNCNDQMENSIIPNTSDNHSLRNCDTFTEELPLTTVEPQHMLLSSQPDLIKETKDVRAWESSNGAQGSSKNSTERNELCNWTIEDCRSDLVRNQVPPVPHPRVNGYSDGCPYTPKRRGFLHKFAIRWPSKRKEIKLCNQNTEITAEDFKETYLANKHNDDCMLSADTMSKNGSIKSSNKDYTESERDKVYEMVKTDNLKTDSENIERMQKFENGSRGNNGGETSIITLSDLAESQSCSAIFQLPLASKKNLNTSNNTNHNTAPSSCSSKSKHITRLDFSALRGEFPSWKSVTGSVDLLPDSSTVSRMSPAPSEVSKTESALFPPPSDLSHTESIRHSHQLGRIEEVATREGIKIALKVRQKQVKEEIVQSAGTQPNVNGIKKKSIEAKPWYDLSDDEDMLTPDRLQSKGIKLRSSSEEEEQTVMQST